MAKAKESIEMIKQFNVTGYDSLRQLSDIALKSWNQIMDAQINAMNSVMNTGMEQFKLASEAKDYQEVVTSQMGLARKLGEELVSKSREAVELSQKTGEEVRGWYESNLAAANEQINKVAEKAA